MLSYQDLIYRGDAILAINERIHQIGRENDPDVLSIRQAVREVSKAYPRPARRGKWIVYTGRGKRQYMCSECSAEEKNPKAAHFCYNCGADMREIDPDAEVH